MFICFIKEIKRLIRLQAILIWEIQILIIMEIIIIIINIFELVKY